jgi:hypothetical protein
MRTYTTDHLLTETVWHFLSQRYSIQDLERVVDPQSHSWMYEISRSLSFRKFQLVEKVYELFDELRQELGDSPLAFNLQYIDTKCKELRPDGGPEVEGIWCLMNLQDLHSWAWAQVRYEFVK